MRLIEVQARLKALQLVGNFSTERRPYLKYEKRSSLLYDLRVSISTDDGFLSVGRHEMGVFTQEVHDDAEAFELFVVSVFQTALENVFELSKYLNPDTYKYWEGWLDAHREDAETLRKDMNL